MCKYNCIHIYNTLILSVIHNHNHINNNRPNNNTSGKLLFISCLQYSFFERNKKKSYNIGLILIKITRIEQNTKEWALSNPLTNQDN